MLRPRRNGRFLSRRRKINPKGSRSSQRSTRRRGRFFSDPKTGKLFDPDTDTREDLVYYGALSKWELSLKKACEMFAQKDYDAALLSTAAAYYAAKVYRKITQE